MDDCLFCKIIRGEIPSKKVYEDELTYAFFDINPQAPTQVQVNGKQHIASLKDCAELSDRELAACLRTAAKVAEELGLNESGYRLVANTGKDACQSVAHMHFHVLGGRQLGENMA